MKLLLVGKKRAGKDAAADYFKAWYGGEKFSFAEPLYQIMYYYQDMIGVKRHKDRKFLQVVGSLARKNNPNIWIDLLVAKVAKVNLKTNIYISDGRYENELNTMKGLGYTIVQIVCPEEIRRLRLDPDDDAEDSHESENGYSADYPFDATIMNDGTLEEFHTKLKALYIDLSKRPGVSTFF